MPLGHFILKSETKKLFADTVLYFQNLTDLYVNYTCKSFNIL